MSGKQILGNYDIDIDNGTSPYYATKRFKSVKSDNVNSLASCSINDRAFAESVNKNKVEETLKLFRDLYKQLLDEHKADRKGERLSAPRFDVEAADRLKKKGKWIYSAKRFGHIPGIAIGDRFRFRTELAVVGLHCQYISGIDYVALNGKKLATSVVNSGRYENRAKTVDVLIYSGHGGLAGRGVNKADQKLERGNLALVNSMEGGYPVRVIRRTNKSDSNGGNFAYTYDGLYVVNRFWRERGCDGKLVFKFELHRMSTQGKLLRESRKSRRDECCVVDDVSRGNEVMPIRVMNGIDGEKPEKFAYITKPIYPEWCKQIQNTGCNCINGCSNFKQCVCVLKNGGEIPYSEKGVLLRQKAIVYECGPSCKCPPCMNRVSQNGPRYKLEVYKTESREWGVRSPSYISSGSFVCEYVGKLQQVKKDNGKVDHNSSRLSSFLSPKSRDHNASWCDENETGFIIDASKLGNVGRFIGHSSSPSLVVQRILYDHDDERMPHIMFFAAKNIPPLQELTCDYDDRMMDRVCRASSLGNFSTESII